MSTQIWKSSIVLAVNRDNIFGVGTSAGEYAQPALLSKLRSSAQGLLRLLSATAAHHLPFISRKTHLFTAAIHILLALARKTANFLAALSFYLSVSRKTAHFLAALSFYLSVSRKRVCFLAGTVNI